MQATWARLSDTMSNKEKRTREGFHLEEVQNRGNLPTMPEVRTAAAGSVDCGPGGDVGAPPGAGHVLYLDWVVVTGRRTYVKIC